MPSPRKYRRRPPPTLSMLMKTVSGDSRASARKRCIPRKPTSSQPVKTNHDVKDTGSPAAPLRFIHRSANAKATATPEPLSLAPGTGRPAIHETNKNPPAAAKTDPARAATTSVHPAPGSTHRDNAATKARTKPAYEIGRAHV